MRSHQPHESDQSDVAHDGRGHERHDHQDYYPEAFGVYSEGAGVLVPGGEDVQLPGQGPDRQDPEHGDREHQDQVVPLGVAQGPDLPGVQGGEAVRVRPEPDDGRHGVEDVHDRDSAHDHGRRRGVLHLADHQDERHGDEGEHERVADEGVVAPEEAEPEHYRERGPENGSGGHAGGVRLGQGVLQDALHPGSGDGQARSGEHGQAYPGETVADHDYVLDDVLDVPGDVVPYRHVGVPEGDGVRPESD